MENIALSAGCGPDELLAVTGVCYVVTSDFDTTIQASVRNGWLTTRTEAHFLLVLQQCPHIERVKLRYRINSIGDSRLKKPFAEQLAALLKGRPRLVALDLGNSFVADTLRPITAIVKDLVYLESFRVNGSYLDFPGITNLSAGLGRSPQLANLRDLQVARAGLNKNGIASLNKLLLKCSGLVSLDIRGANLSGGLVPGICAALTSCTQLECLLVSGTELNCLEIQTLVDTYPNLRQLEFGRNPLMTPPADQSDIVRLFESIAQMPRLTTLETGGDWLTPDLLVRIAANLFNIPALTLSWAASSVECMRTVVMICGASRVLKELNLDHGRISETGLDMLTPAVRLAPRLETLSIITTVPFSAAETSLLTRAVAASTTIVDLRVGAELLGGTFYEPGQDRIPVALTPANPLQRALSRNRMFHANRRRLALMILCLRKNHVGITELPPEMWIHIMHMLFYANIT
jgi:hypothetical protein